MPVDTEPVATGNVALTLEGDQWVADVIGGPAPPGSVRYISHHATCPHGQDWKR